MNEIYNIINENHQNEINNLKENFKILEERKEKEIEIEKKENEKKLYEISLNSKIITNDYNKIKVLREWINPNKEINLNYYLEKVKMVHMEKIFINIVIRKDQH